MPAPELVTIPNVELLQAGTWDAMTGEFTATVADIAACVAAQNDPGLRTPIIKLGHVDPRFDGQPAVGTVRNMRASADGRTLLGDLTDIPAWLAQVMKSAFPSRSIEGAKNLTTATGTHAMAITGLALLGVSPPAIETLADIADLYGIAAGAHEAPGTPFVLAHQEAPMPETEIADPTVDVTDPTPVESPTPQAEEANRMNVSDLAARLGLPAEATDEDITKAIDDRNAALELVNTAPKAEIPDGMKLVSEGVLEQLEIAASKGSQAHETLRVQARDQFIDGAVRAGKIAPAQKATFSALYDADETGTRHLITDVLAAGAVPLTELGNGTNPENTTSDDALFDALFGNDPQFTHMKEA